MKESTFEAAKMIKAEQQLLEDFVNKFQENPTRILHLCTGYLPKEIIEEWSNGLIQVAKTQIHNLQVEFDKL